MGNEDAGDMDLLVQPPQPAPKLLTDLGVESPERLVQQQQLGLDRHGSGQRHPLALAA